VQAFALISGTGVAQLLVAALYILTARTMSPSEYGLIVSAIALGVVCGGFLDFGANLYWVRELANKRLSHTDFVIRVSNRALIVLVVSAATAISAAFLAPVFIATGVLLFTTNAVQTVLVPLRADQRSESVGWLVALGRLVAALTFLVQTGFGTPPATCLWTSLALGDLVVVVCAHIVTPGSARLTLRCRPAVNPWVGAKWYAAVALGNSAGQLDLPIMVTIADPFAAGIYAGVNRWIQPINVAIGAFASAAAPFIAAERRLAVVARQIRRAAWILLAAAGLSVAMFVVAPWLVPAVLGDDYSGAVPVLRLLALAMLLNTASQPLLVGLQARGFDHVAAVIVTLSVASHLAVVVLLCPKIGALGAGIGAVGAQSIALIGALLGLSTIVRNKKDRDK
jgi:O-antigen/teichoic acid export membrane protein